MTRTILVHLGDRHAGLLNGLCPPDMEIVYGNLSNWLVPGMSEEEIDKARAELDVRQLTLSSWSDWLWHEVWLPGIEEVGEIAGDDPVVIFDSGDMVHGSRFVESLYTPFIHHQVDISVESMRPWRELKNLYGIAMVYGTGSHDYGANAAAKKVYDGLAPWGYRLWLDEHISMTLDGVRIDLAHHGSNLSKRRHLRYNTFRLDMEQLMRDALEFSERPPNIYMRGHYHNPALIPVLVDWSGSYVQAWASINPPMCGPNGYARQATRSMPKVSCGFHYYVLDSGRVINSGSFIRVKDTRAYFTVDTGNLSFLGKGGFKKPGKKKKKSV